LIDRPVLFEGWKADEVTEGELRKMRKKIPYVMCVATRCTHVHHTPTHTHTREHVRRMSEGKIRKVIELLQNNFPPCVVVQLDRSMID